MADERYNDDGYMDRYTPSIFPLEFPICFVSETDFEVSILPLEFPFALGVDTIDMLEFPLELNYANDQFPYTFPLLLGGNAEVILVSEYGITLNTSLETGTFIQFGTVPKGSYAIYTTYLFNVGNLDMNGVVIEGIENDSQIGTNENTINSLYFQYDNSEWYNRSIEIGTVLGDYGLSSKVLRIKWSPPYTAISGLKVFFIQISGNWEGY